MSILRWNIRIEARMLTYNKGFWLQRAVIFYVLVTHFSRCLFYVYVCSRIYMKLCIDNLKKSFSVSPALRLLTTIIDSYPKTVGEADEKKVRFFYYYYLYVHITLLRSLCVTLLCALC